MASWFWKKRAGRKKKKKEVLDGSDVEELVGNKEAFTNYVDHKFHELDKDHDGELSVKELQPAIADIGAALGLLTAPSDHSDHIYGEVLNEYTHGKQDKMTKSEFKEVLSDILLGMAAGLKRDPIVILRIDGEDLKEFIESPRFEPEAVAIFSRVESGNATLGKCLLMSLEQLKVEHGMPPPSDSLVFRNILEPVLESSYIINQEEQTASQEMFLEEFKKLLQSISQRLQECPVIVAHSENIFDGSGIKRLLSNKFELDKLLNAAWNDLPKDQNHKISKDYLRVALDGIAASADLPPYGDVNQVDTIVNEAVKMVNSTDDEGKIANEEEFNTIMTEILQCIMLKLEGSPISISSDSVVHEASSSSVSPLTEVSPAD